MSWDGDPALNAGRKHPLGVVVETRGMGWNFPTGNEDIIYFIYTFYNVTTTNPADYVNIRPEMVSILVDKAQEFQAKNNATFNVSLPTGGYTIDNLYAAFATDMDVASAGTNYSSVNLPFALGYTYVADVRRRSLLDLRPEHLLGALHARRRLRRHQVPEEPDGPGAIQLFSNTVNGSPFPGAFNDPQNAIQLWRYLSGNISVPAGDQPCNTGLPSQTRICWINNTQRRRHAVLPVLHRPVAAPGRPGFHRRGVHLRRAGGRRRLPRPGPDLRRRQRQAGRPDASSASRPRWRAASTWWTASPGTSRPPTSTRAGSTSRPAPPARSGPWCPNSLLGKSYTAQAVFDAKFLLPFAPDAPKFFLIPSNNQVTVVWQASAVGSRRRPVLRHRLRPGQRPLRPELS